MQNRPIGALVLIVALTFVPYTFPFAAEAPNGSQLTAVSLASGGGPAAASNGSKSVSALGPAAGTTTASNGSELSLGIFSGASGFPVAMIVGSIGFAAAAAFILLMYGQRKISHSFDN